MRTNEIHEGRRYRTRQGWVYRVISILTDGSTPDVHYRVMSGPSDLVGKECSTTLLNFRQRVVGHA